MDLDINLLVKKNNYYKIERLFQQGRRLTVLLGIIAVIILTGLFVIQQNLKRKIDVLASEKLEIEADLASKKDIEGKIRLLNNKMVAMKTVVDQSPDYGVYYDRLQKYLPKTSEDGVLTKVSFTSPNFAVIELEFADILSLTRFLGVVESKEFLNEFNSIKLSNIIFANSTEVLTLKVSLEFNNEVQN
jgi:Tfp pilus assembly protein PilN